MPVARHCGPRCSVDRADEELKRGRDSEFLTSSMLGSESVPICRMSLARLLSSHSGFPTDDRRMSLKRAFNEVAY
jgi:hypothetical protein